MERVAPRKKRRGSSALSLDWMEDGDRLRYHYCRERRKALTHWLDLAFEDFPVSTTSADVNASSLK